MSRIAVSRDAVSRGAAMFWLAFAACDEPLHACGAGGACLPGYCCTAQGVCRVPGPELAGDGIDNDCDGLTDPERPCVGESCSGCCDAESDADECADDRMVCGVCQDVGGSRSELRGGGDEDCDGVVDDGCGCAPEPWRPETAGADATGGVALVVDGIRAVHVVFRGPAGRDPRYATRTPVFSWTVEDLDADSGGGCAAAALAPDGTLHAITDGLGPEYLWHRLRVPLELAWRGVNSLIGIGAPACDLDAAVGADGRLRIAYREAGDGTLRVAESSGSGWVLQPVSPGATGPPASLVVDDAGVPHVVYQDERGDLWHARSLDGKRWAIDGEPLARTPHAGVALARRDATLLVAYLDAKGRPALAMREGDDPWRSETADPAPPGPAIAVDLAAGGCGDLHLVYATATAVQRARRDADGAWATDRVEAVAARSPSLAVDRDGGVHVAYRDVGRGVVRYARACP